MRNRLVWGPSGAPAGGSGGRCVVSGVDSDAKRRPLDRGSTGKCRSNWPQTLDPSTRALLTPRLHECSDGRQPGPHHSLIPGPMWELERWGAGLQVPTTTYYSQSALSHGASLVRKMESGGHRRSPA